MNFDKIKEMQQRTKCLNDFDPLKEIRRMKIVAAVMAIIGLGFFGGAIYLLLHFVLKFW